ncbi:MAG TPA: hypothetical protein VMU54_18970 [Planctomycetota bacterium]|nr:hypothetical protein [Planctomycetota bacterium]
MATDGVQDSELPGRGLTEPEGDPFDPDRPLAVFLVGGAESLGPAAFDLFRSLYSREFPQVLFVSIGVLDQSVVDAGVDGSGNFNGTEEAHRLRKKTREGLSPYLESARRLGLKAAGRVSVSVDAAEEIARMSDGISAVHPKAVYFLSKLVFQKPRWFHRWLHSRTSDSIRKNLEKRGHPVTVLPVVLPL